MAEAAENTLKGVNVCRVLLVFFTSKLKLFSVASKSFSLYGLYVFFLSDAYCIFLERKQEQETNVRKILIKSGY